MTDPRLEHLDPATIAAFVDQTLDPAARAAAEAHLAACADCREVWVDTSEIDSEMRGATTSETSRGAVVPARPASRRAWIYGAAGIAAAAVLATSAWLLMRPSERERAIMALQPDGATHRFTSGRLSTPYRYLPAGELQRGTAPPKPPASVQRSALLLQELNDSRTAPALHAAGLAHLALGDPSAAVENLAAAVAAAPGDAALHSDLSAALLERWRAAGETTDATRALDEAKRAVLLARDSPAPQFNLALAYEALGLSTQARSAFQQYLRLDPSSEWADEARRRLERLPPDGQGGDASLSRLLRELEARTLPAWGTAVLAGNIPDLGPLRAAERQLGATGDGYAVATLRAALEANRLPAERSCAASAAIATSDWLAAFETGRSEEALASARRARIFLRCAGLSTADAASREATSLLELNRLDEADAIAAQVLADPAALTFHRARARAFQARALIAQQQTRFDDAVEHSLRAVDAAGASGDLEFKAALATHVASLFSKQGDVRKAWSYLGTALRGEAGTESLRRRYSIFGRAIVSAFELQLPGAALAFSEALLERTAGWSNRLAHVIAHLKRAESLAQLNLRPEARLALAEASKLIPEITSPRLRTDLHAQAALTAGIVAESAPEGIRHLDQAVAYFTDAGNRLLLAPSLLARGHLHQRAAQHDRAEQDWQRGVALVEDQRLEIRDAQLQISRIDRVWELFDALTGLVANTRPLDALEITERNRARQLLSSMSRTQRLEPLRGGRLHSWLPGDADALVYSVLPDRLLIWHLTRGSATLSTVSISRAALDAQVTSFRESLRRHSLPAAPAELERIVIPASLRPRATLLIVADGPLHLLPFAALRGTNGGFLAERTDVVTGASLTTAAAASAATVAAGGPALLVGANLGDPREGLPPLPGVEREVAAIAPFYPGARVLKGSEATPAALLEALPSHALVHFAGHAVTDALFPNRSRLVLAAAGGASNLTSEQIASTVLRPGTTVVLGACDTANGEIFRGEGALALSRAFFAAGARTVVAALWKLSDEEGQRFLIDFHRRLQQSSSAPRALSDTQRAWIQSGGAPSVWASFQVVGALPMGPTE